MIFLLVLHVVFVYVSDCVLITVRRETNYDTMVWDGDCSRLNANYAGFANERTCVCHKKLKVNKIETELKGTLYQTARAFPTCIYDYREIGANMFASSYSQQIYTVSGRSSIFLRSNKRSRFTKNEVIYIKDILLYNFRIDEPFIKLPRNTFMVTNSSSSFYRNYFYLQVNRSAIRKYKGNLMQIIFELDSRPYGTKRTFGFMVIKFAGERKCCGLLYTEAVLAKEFLPKNCYLCISFIAVLRKSVDDMDLQPETKTPQMSKDGSWKIGNIVLGTISGILAIVIVILIVKQRRSKSKYSEVNKESKKSEEKNVATERRNEPYMIHDPSRSTQTSVNNNKNQSKPNDTHYDKPRHCVTSDARSKWNNNQKMKPMDMGRNAYVHCQNVQSDLQTMRSNYQNTNYVYDEILE